MPKTQQQSHLDLFAPRRKHAQAESMAALGDDRDGIVKRFWSKVEKGKPDECWLWKAAKSATGYGYFPLITKRPKRSILAHRMAYLIKHGSIPAGMYVCHRCDTPSCVNASHLFLGTQFDNLRDASRKGRLPNGEQKSKLKKADVEEMRESYAKGGTSCAKLGRRYGVTGGTVNRIVNFQRWKKP